MVCFIFHQRHSSGNMVTGFTTLSSLMVGFMHIPTGIWTGSGNRKDFLLKMIINPQWLEPGSGANVSITGLIEVLYPVSLVWHYCLSRAGCILTHCIVICRHMT